MHIITNFFYQSFFSFNNIINTKISLLVLFLIINNFAKSLFPKVVNIKLNDIAISKL